MDERLCRQNREELLDFLEQQGPDAALPEALSAHVATCPSCRRLLDTAVWLAEGLHKADLYGPQLKSRALEALTADRAEPDLIRFLAPASVLSFAVWFLAPWLIVARVIGWWLPGTLVPLMVAAALMSSVGLIIALFVFALLHTNQEVWKRGGTRVLAEVRHV